MSLGADIQNPSGSNQPILAMADSTSWENYSVEEWERWAAEPITGGVPAPMRPGWTATWKRPVPAASALPPPAAAVAMGSVRSAQRRPNGGLMIKYHRRVLYPEWEGQSLPTPEEILGEEAAEARRHRNQAEEAIAEQASCGIAPSFTQFYPWRPSRDLLRAVVSAVDLVDGVVEELGHGCAGRQGQVCECIAMPSLNLHRITPPN